MFDKFNKEKVMKTNLEKITSKIKSRHELIKIVDKWKKDDKKVVMTNGCFDILHYGHLNYLSNASDLGDFFVVAVNSTYSVKRLKGKSRPINDDLTRFYMLASLIFVDAVVVFEEDTPFELIKNVVPDVLVKGGDWNANQIIGSKIVLSNGGIVKSLPFLKGYSTTNTIKKIQANLSE